MQRSQALRGRDAAARVIAEARTAMGGDAKLAAVKTFIVTGRTRQVRGENLVPIEFEIQAELPDKFSRRDEFPAQDAGPTVTGFVGDRCVQIRLPQPPPPRPGRPAAAHAAAARGGGARAAANAKQDFARLMLGLFAASYPSHPAHLCLCRTGRSAAGQGRRAST